MVNYDPNVQVKKVIEEARKRFKKSLRIYKIMI
jgi:hypothetical protein